jgi:hypothetical protein
MTAKGLRDVLGLRRHVRVTTDELWADPPERLVPRWLRLPVNQRVFSNGVLLKRWKQKMSYRHPECCKPKESLRRRW